MHQEILDSGFIPDQICEKLPSSFDDIENLASELPKVLANEQIVERANFGRFRNILVCLEYAKTFSSLQPEALEGLLNVMYYGAKKTFDPLNGSFVKIF